MRIKKHYFFLNDTMVDDGWLGRDLNPHSGDSATRENKLSSAQKHYFLKMIQWLMMAGLDGI